MWSDEVILGDKIMEIGHPVNRIWEIFSTGYDAAITEVTDLGNRTETSTSN